MRKLLKKLIPGFIRKIIRNTYAKFMKYNAHLCNLKALKKLKSKHTSRRLILIGTPEHGNLGDQAIAEAENIYLCKNIQGIPTIEISLNNFNSNLLNIKGHITIEDIILIHGGGFLGNLWLDGEELFRTIIKEFPDNRLIAFPQTIFFSNDHLGENEFNTSKKIYNEHKCLTIFLREEMSYKYLKKNILERSNNIFLVPDIALYLNETKQSCKRKGILLCIRKDKETILPEDDKHKIESYALASGEKIHYSDTEIYKTVSRNNRNRFLEKKFNEFRKAKLVITDRLHGMIFAVITSTPCIALNNISSKVEGVYQWIKYLDYITFVDSVDRIPQSMDKLLSLPNCSYDNSCLKKEFEKITNAIMNEWSSAL